MTDQQVGALEAEIAPVPKWLKKSYVKARVTEVLPNIVSDCTKGKLAGIVCEKMVDRWNSGEINSEDQLREAIDAELRKYVNRVEPSSNNKLSVASIVATLRASGQEVDQAIVDQANLKLAFGTQVRPILMGHPDFALESIIPVGVVGDKADEIAGMASEILLMKDGAPKQNPDDTWRVAKWIPDDQIEPVIERIVADEGYEKSITSPSVRSRLTAERARDIGDELIEDTVTRLLAYANARKDDHQPTGRTYRMRVGQGNTDGG
ncbi:MAG: hypothetical protein CL969_06475 [Euryarchaeota archaeon]|jgi:hypothetical protein|nr:hypothetical protein [Euryarchaeota archaeon]MDP6575749.1 hypothetical protein [Candidatus Peribacteraceae bacterium]HCI04327.1 hypothetical protein [Candidatus Peribacteria bacterium]|tara:strand:- start:2230 stop:3021 length:792 start_codon:yes stop_codon:yes gene_type:complete